MNKIRSFAAIPLNLEVVSNIEKAQIHLKALAADVKWVKPGSIHLTLKFLGNIDETDIEKIAPAIQKAVAGFQPWQTEVKNLGAFPSLRNPRVVWAGIDDPDGRLIELQARIENELLHLGFEKESRKFSPHLTLGRVKSSRGKADLVRYIMDEREKFFGEIKIDRIILFKSDLQRTGAVYTGLRELELE